MLEVGKVRVAREFHRSATVVGTTRLAGAPHASLKPPASVTAAAPGRGRKPGRA